MEKLLNRVHTKSWTRKKDFILIFKINEIYRLKNHEFHCDNQAISEYENPQDAEEMMSWKSYQVLLVIVNLAGVWMWWESEADLKL